MTEARRPRDWRWVTGGAVVFALVGVILLRYHAQEFRAAQFTANEQRLDSVQKLKVALAKASESEMSAVLAVSDTESTHFANQARTTLDALARERDSLEQLVQASGTPDEQGLLANLTEALAQYRRLDTELLDLAVRNTNLKAANLAFGPAATAVGGMDGALSRIVRDGAGSTASQARRVMVLASAADGAALRIQALLPRHIAEETDTGMAAMESTLAAEEQLIANNLEALAAMPAVARTPDFKTAQAGFTSYREQVATILDLSRQNTNVRSLTISLNQRRLGVLKCQQALVELETAIRGEPLPQVPVNPR